MDGYIYIDYNLDYYIGCILEMLILVVLSNARTVYVYTLGIHDI